jgi:putative MATE family efflux protein
MARGGKGGVAYINTPWGKVKTLFEDAVLSQLPVEQKRPLLFSNKELVTLIIPIVIERILDVSIGFADTLMISSVGEAAVSSISLVDSVNYLFLFLFSALAAGGAVVVAQYIGQRNAERAGEAAKQLIYTTTLVALMFTTAFLIFNRTILIALFGSLDPEVLDQAQIYFAFTALSFPFLGLFNSGAALFRSMGNSRITMRVSVVMTLSNIAGNALLIYVFKLGVLGAGIASLASRILASSIMLSLLMNKTEIIRIERLLQIKFEWTMVKRILRIGIPNGIESGIFHIGKILVLSLTATFGTIAIAANAITNSIASMTNIPGGAIGLATITVVGQCMGAGEFDQAAYYAKKLLKSAYITMAALAVILFILVEPMVHLFNLSEASTTLAIQILKIMYVMSTLLWPVAFTLPQVLRASGDVKFTMTVSIISMWTFRVGLSYIFGKVLGLGLHGVWFAMYVDWICRSTCFVTRFLKGTWKTKRVI